MYFVYRVLLRNNLVLLLVRKVYMRLHLLVLQVAIIRPLLMFIAAVLWADGNYTPGLVSDWHLDSSFQQTTVKEN
jgi:hypothetical protein